MNNGQDLHSFRINRNIVECKEAHGFDNLSAQDCINRNIVECKVNSILHHLKRNHGINRNIVECKGYSSIGVVSLCATVLIETLWNVKSGVWDNKILRSVVLIETLWNVKVIKAQMFPCFPVCINRNIVECKETTKGLGNRAEFRY